MKSYRVRCTCKHLFQDAVYGVGIRVASPVCNKNAPGAGNGMQGVRCSVCGRIHVVAA